MIYILLLGDVLDGLKLIKDESINCIVTSPPYWGLRDYGVEGQIGLEPTLDEYLTKMLTITTECKRVLRKDGVMWWNHGDCYGGTGKKGEYRDPKYPLGRNSINPPNANLTPKCMALQNYRLILKMIDEQGWILRNIVIWHKCLGGNVPIYAKTNGKAIRTLVKDLAKLPTETLYLPTPKGWKKVKKIERQPKGELITIHLRNGTKIETTPEHRFLCNSRLIEARFLKKGIILDHGRLPDEKGTPLGTCENGWIVGLWLAEGNYEYKRKALRFSLNFNEKEYVLKIKKWALKYGGRFRTHRHNKVRVVVVTGEVPYAIIKHYTSGSGAKLKRLSHWAFSESNKFLKGVLDGFLAGDGYYDSKNNRWRFPITTNKALIEDLKAICNRLGYYMRTRKWKRKGFGKIFNVFDIEIRKKRTGHFNQKDDFEIMRIEKTKGVSYEIEIEEPHVFILPDGTLTHNSNHMPSSVRDRLTNAYEPVFMLVKSKKYWFDLDAIREPHSSYEQEMRRKILDNKGKNHLRQDLANRPRDAYYHKLGKNPGDVWEIELKERAKKGGAQREAYRVWQEWKKEHPNGTYEEFYREVASKKISKYVGSSKYSGRKESLFENFSDYLSLPNPLGKNPSDLWSLSTEPFPEAHFATFPRKLIERPIKATCPQWICNKCNKPRVRITKTKQEINRWDDNYWWNFLHGTSHTNKFYKQAFEILKKWMTENNCYDYEKFYSWWCRQKSGRWASGNLQKGQGAKFDGELPFPKPEKRLPTQTVGFTDCGCGKGFHAGWVLDPFLGSGTTFEEAMAQKKNAIGIELNPKYAELVKKRLKFPLYNAPFAGHTFIIYHIKDGKVEAYGKPLEKYKPEDIAHVPLVDEIKKKIFGGESNGKEINP